MKHHILLVDDDPTLIKAMTGFLDDEGFSVTTCENGFEAIALVRQKIQQFSVALIDYNMPDINGAETIRKIKEADDDIIIYGFSGDDSPSAFTDTVKSGGAYVIPKDINNEKLLGLLHSAVADYENSTKELTVDCSETENIDLIKSVRMIGCSGSLAEVARQIHKFARIDSTILIRGENGTGKERVACAIHELSKRRNRKFISVNCASINPNLFESEFFGHQKGAFTGALKDKKGFFEQADGGTLFLDEFGELSVEMQVKLLRVLQQKTIIPMGSTHEIKVDFRLITATNRDLDRMMKLGEFRDDVYYRINAFTIQLSPLRARKEDIPHLVKYFLDKLNVENGATKTILNSSVEKMKKTQWPGNIRQLENFLERVFYESIAGAVLDKTIIKNYVDNLTSKKINKLEVEKDQEAFRKLKRADEKAIYLKALQGSDTITEIAEKLDVARSTVREKFKKYGLSLIK